MDSTKTKSWPPSSISLFLEVSFLPHKFCKSQTILVFLTPQNSFIHPHPLHKTNGLEDLFLFLSLFLEVSFLSRKSCQCAVHYWPKLFPLRSSQTQVTDTLMPANPVHCQILPIKRKESPIRTFGLTWDFEMQIDKNTNIRRHKYKNKKSKNTEVQEFKIRYTKFKKNTYHKKIQ